MRVINIRKIFRGVSLQLFKENAVFSDFAKGLTISGARNPQTDRARGTVAREPNHPDIMAEILSSELSTNSHLLGKLVDLLLPLKIAEASPMLVSGGREIIEIASRSKLDSLESHLSRKPANDHGKMVRRAGGGSKGFDLLIKELEKGVRVQQGLGLLIQKGLVGGAPSLGHEEEVILGSLGSIKLNLGGKVGPCVGLLKHVKGRSLGVAEVCPCVSVVNPAGKMLLVLAVGPDPAPSCQSRWQFRYPGNQGGPSQRPRWRS